MVVSRFLYVDETRVTIFLYAYDTRVYENVFIIIIIIIIIILNTLWILAAA